MSGNKFVVVFLVGREKGGENVAVVFLKRKQEHKQKENGITTKYICV